MRVHQNHSESLDAFLIFPALSCEGSIVSLALHLLCHLGGFCRWAFAEGDAACDGLRWPKSLDWNRRWNGNDGTDVIAFHNSRTA